MGGKQNGKRAILYNLDALVKPEYDVRNEIPSLLTGNSGIMHALFFLYTLVH